MNLCLATPTMYSQVASGYAKTLVALGRVCQVRGINFFAVGVDSSDHVTARNLMVKQFLEHEDRTHLLMVDADSEVGLKPMDELLGCDHDFAALPFCKRQIAMGAFAAACRSGHTMPVAMAASLDWCLDLEDGLTPVVDGFMRVRRTGFGCVLLKRHVLEKIPGGWFDRMDLGGELLSEDMSFCERARTWEIYPQMLVTHAVYHCGSFNYGARLLDDPRLFPQGG